MRDAGGKRRYAHGVTANQLAPRPRSACCIEAEYSMPRQIHIGGRLPVVAILLAALLHAHSVGAETGITGEPDAVRVEARDASLEEVLAALKASFGLHYRSSASLDRRVNGKYEGPLQRVVTRLLEGYDFVVKNRAGNIEVIVFGMAKSGVIPPATMPRRRSD
jgi:hypothetical protein